MATPDSRPHVAMKPGGSGVSAQRTNMEKSYPLAQYEGNVNTPDKRPHVKSNPGASGVAAQRQQMNHGNRVSAVTGLSAPFPYFGGKSRLAPAIWQRLGNPVVYVEPFAGSLACLLARPDGAGQREIVCDLDGGISNFWRAVEAEPDTVAYWADYPTFHHDLTARHKWLRAWFAEHSAELSADPHFYCAKVAGWWVWGISLWIGGGWCNAISTRKDGQPWDGMPHAGHTGGGNGVSAQRVWDVRPAVTSANGVSAQAQRAQRLNTPDQRPHAGGTNGQGSGVSAQRTTRPDLVEWFRAIQERLKGVIVLNRSWESALTPTLLMHTPTAPKPPVGILLDPPYLTVDRQSELYGSDADGSSSDVATAAYQWALANGERFRIAYCCHEGDFPVPDGWTFITSSFGGVKDAERRAARQDMVMFSPLCVPDKPDPQMALL